MISSEDSSRRVHNLCSSTHGNGPNAQHHMHIKNVNVGGFVHIHPAYPNDNGTWNPVDYGPSDTDLWLFNVPGINRQFIANEQGQIYEFLEDGTMIIIQP